MQPSHLVRPSIAYGLPSSPRSHLETFDAELKKRVAPSWGKPVGKGKVEGRPEPSHRKPQGNPLNLARGAIA